MLSLFSRAALTGAATAALLLAGAVPADGAALPEDDALHVIDCDTELESRIVVFGVDAASVAADEVGGTTLSGDGCALQPAYDPTTGRSYFVELVDPDLTFLFELDLESGAATEIGRFTLAGFPDEHPLIPSIAITPAGDAYAIGLDENLYALDLATAVLTLIEQIDEFGPFPAFTAEPGTGRLLAVSLSDDTLYSIDPADASATAVFALDAGPDTNVLSIQFDSAGTLWFLTSPFLAPDPAASAPELWSTAGPGTEMAAGALSSGGTTLYAGALLITPAPQRITVPAQVLPPTGSGSAALPLLAGAGFALLGLALVLGRRRLALRG